jgi:hypothetical protein
MMGKGEARYTLTPVPSLAEHSKSLPEQSHLRANCPRDGLATRSTRRLRRFHVSALHRRWKSRSITAFVMRSEWLSSS